MKRASHIYSLIILIGILSCSPKTTTPVEEEEEVTIPIKQEPENPCIQFSQLSNTERDEIETAYVLYKDLVKQSNYEAAFPYWEKAYYGAPGSNGRVTYQFDDGVAIYTNKYNLESDSSIKAIYVDSVMSIYDKRMECFGDEAYVLGRKAFDYYYTFPGTKSDTEVYEMFKKNFDVNGKKVDYFVVNPFTKLLSDKIIADEVSYEEGRKYAKMISEAVEYGVANCKGVLCESWEIINEYAPARMESLEGIDGFYDCDYYSSKYYSRFEANPEDCDIIGLVGRRLKRGECSETDPKLIALTNAYNDNCKQEVVIGPLQEAYNLYREGRIRQAIGKFDDYIGTSQDVDKKAEINLLIAKIYYGDLKDFPKSRTYALAAANLNSKWGEPYMLIGKLYASSGPLCGSGRGWDSQVVTWVAIDKFQYAKKIDSSVSSEATKWINQYSQYMPKKEDIFQRRIKEGDSYRVPCWIQENTIVRTAD